MSEELTKQEIEDYLEEWQDWMNAPLGRYSDFEQDPPDDLEM